MKLRTTHNSIRIRVRKSELSVLEQDQIVRERVRFPNGVVFTFALAIQEDIDAISARMNENEWIISLPKHEAHQWVTSEQIGLEQQIPLPDNEELQVLVEKDFPCKDRPEEELSDTFWELAEKTADTC